VEDKYSWNSSVCLFEMNKAIHDLILDYKYKGQIEIYPFFAQEAANRILKENLKFDLITSVPLHPLKFLTRGFNQSALIAKRVSKLTQIPYSSILSRKKYTRTQTVLTAEKRRKNLKGVFLIKKRAIIEGQVILLIDDIFTTGSTLRSASEELIKSGAKKVTILVLARR
jgi:ComF family protein